MRGGAVLCVLLLSLAWLSPAWGAEGGEEDGEVLVAEEEDEDEEDEVLSDELMEEDGVLVLHEHNFARALREHRLLLVEFYAPWCGHCRRFAPEFARAAALLRNGSEAVRLGKVDAVAQTALSAEFHIEAFPTLKLFRDGNRTHPVAYSGRMDAEGMVLWVQRRAGPSATLLHDADTVAAFIGSQDITVVGFFKVGRGRGGQGWAVGMAVLMVGTMQDLRGEAAQAFYEVAAEVVDVVFGVAEEDELFEAYGLSADTVCLFKKFDEGRTDFPVDPEQGLEVAELTRLLRVHSLQLVMDFSNETSGQIFGAKIPNHMLLFLNTSVAEQQALRDEFRAAASTFRGEVRWSHGKKGRGLGEHSLSAARLPPFQVLFVVVDVDGYGATVLPFFGLTPSDAPTLRFIKMENNRKYRMEADAFSTTAVRDFVQAVLDGKVKPQLLSAEPPEDWNTRPVKVLVGKTFEQVAFDETKNVFVKFYAPWCTHCQEMAAAWEELGERYKDHEDIVIAEMDATANELENITISGYPTLHYFPAGPGRKMVEYRSARDVETFSKFLENGGKLPEEPPTVSKAPENSTESPSPSGTAEAREEL
ncbi:protein disulfide-isomerase A2 [Phasianus colchicus]|uniref:protein disulfide-isomerase A2 n=1 Tax=Phasianus colchicus TaxID=9054 RepID=UPI00129E68C8|nr:protein disulfide-isomerase A2 [Phasianus colchicus]